jgi:Ser/Thr protein kinase RdoA (MazF antagonist)
LRRTGVSELPRHLAATYGIEVAVVEELDLGTYRVELSQGVSWVARLFPAERPPEQTRGDAKLLEFLAEVGYPAERCAAADAVSFLEGQALLVTEFVPPVARAERREAIRAAGGLAALGSLLGRLQRLPAGDAATARPGGSWHHLADGAPGNEIAAIGRLLEDRRQHAGRSARPLLEPLAQEIASLESGDGLPESLVHPDFVLANVIAARSGGLVLVDWAGGGQAPRMWSFAFLLWSVGAGGDLARVERTVAGYRRQLVPEPEELARLETLIRARPTIFAAWSFCAGRRTLAQALASIAAGREAATAIAARARAALGE